MKRIAHFKIIELVIVMTMIMMMMMTIIIIFISLIILKCAILYIPPPPPPSQSIHCVAIVFNTLAHMATVQCVGESRATRQFGLVVWRYASLFSLNKD